jgi:hypothetical protein
LVPIRVFQKNDEIKTDKKNPKATDENEMETTRWKDEEKTENRNGSEDEMKKKYNRNLAIVESSQIRSSSENHCH